MESRDPGFPGEFGQNSTPPGGEAAERRFGEAAHAYRAGQSGTPAPDPDHPVASELADGVEYGQRGYWQGEARPGDYGESGYWADEEAEREQGGAATSSATVGTGAPRGLDSGYGTADEGLPTSGGADGGDHGALGTANTGSGAGLSSGNPAGLSTGTMTGDDAERAQRRANVDQQG